MAPPSLLATLSELAASESHVAAAVEFAERVEDAAMSSPFVDHMAIYKELDALYGTIVAEKKTWVVPSLFMTYTV